MLYLVMPGGRLKWTANIGESVFDLVKAEGKDFALLDWWEDASRTADEDDVRVALRYGVVCSTGLVVDAGHVVTVRRPGELRETFRESAAVRARASEQVEAIDTFIDEHMAPGWKQAGVELDARVDESLAQSLAEAEREAQEKLTACAPQEALKDHWVSIGGWLPDPL